MTANNWRALTEEKYQLSLKLFLFLNLFSALFNLVDPLYDYPHIPWPALSVIALSGALLLRAQFRAFSLKAINLTALLAGALWSWNIALKSPWCVFHDGTCLLITLLGALFIATLSFINMLAAFSRFCLPITATILLLDKGQHPALFGYTLTLPLIGLVMQHLIARRSDIFARQMMQRLIEEKATLTDLSMMDPLTGLCNRRGFQNRLANLPPDAGQQFVLLMDIDHFKAYNDHYGHMMGDQALTRVSAAIRDCVRSRDIVTRYGGEEFMVLLTHADEQSARMTAERIRQRVFDLRIPHIFNESVATNVTLSIGIAPLERGNIDDALRCADEALYAAKNKGRNHILYYEARRAA
ncbi:GGDEF domain-containing protein [Cronobacter sp. JZ38]|uniref:GGDEF domain-containing protein n=1 Tax=Cronobacter sp. JZ38 TaxID=1906275 RepID=UPI0012A23F6B|nr:GGDEF domain-containing protein [Cronobacter sp. JZ38]